MPIPPKASPDFFSNQREHGTVPYGWLIKHQLTGQYGVVSAAPDGLTVAVTSDPEAATLFPNRAQAVETIFFLQRESTTFPDCDVVDYSTRPTPITDADKPVIRTLDQVLADAYAAGAERRAAHAAARDAARSAPSARLIQKPASKGN